MTMTDSSLHLYNSLSRKLERFEPIAPPRVGMYVCGPTVYGDAHLGHARTYVTFDLLYRYLTHIGYKVRYVRNITDVGHLLNDADEGEDKIGVKARLEQLEPMEIAQQYANRFHDDMDALGVTRPSIEPLATGHIPEQIEMVQELVQKGLAYASNGSVYFSVSDYEQSLGGYGVLSGRDAADQQAGQGSRTLDGQEEKRSPNDFALWKKAGPEHIMRWNSPWGEGFPGWHIECSAMSKKYLGHLFDIHGGGMDLLFPHHEAEIAQSKGCSNQVPARYWLHSNMLTVNGQKMAKSLQNGISLVDLFQGSHPLLEQAYSPMVLRFFILQAHYRSTLDFSNEALKAAEKGLNKLFKARKSIHKIKPRTGIDDIGLQGLFNQAEEAMNNDLGSPTAIAVLFDIAKIINGAVEGLTSINEYELELLKVQFPAWLEEVLGLKAPEAGHQDQLGRVMDVVIHLRSAARQRKDFALSDQIRDELLAKGIRLMDSKEATGWEVDGD